MFYFTKPDGAILVDDQSIGKKYGKWFHPTPGRKGGHAIEK